MLDSVKFLGNHNQKDRDDRGAGGVILQFSGRETEQVHQTEISPDCHCACSSYGTINLESFECNNRYQLLLRMISSWVLG